MLAAQKAVGPACHRATLDDGVIKVDAPWEQLAAEVQDGVIVVLKGAYPPDAMLAFRAAAARWGQENPVFPHGSSPAALPDLNYHRIDDGAFPSVCPHVFHQFGFKSIDRLDATIRGSAHRLAETMKDVQNKIAGTSFEVSLTDLYFKVLHYPAGGGFLAEHSHPLLPQKVGLITSLSRLGADVHGGGTVFDTPLGRVDLSDDHDIGDIAVFRYDLPHAVPPVDPDSQLNWASEVGKWSVVLELRETHGLSHAGR